MQRVPFTVIGWPSRSPNAASSSCSTSSMTLPKRSMLTAWATISSASARASGMCSVTRSSGSIGSPAAASGAPAASAAATGAKMSRPWNVADAGSRRCGESADVDRLDGAAEARDGERQQPVVGPDEDAVVLGDAHGDGEPLAADLGVDDGQVDARRAVRAARAAGRARRSARRGAGRRG